LPPGVGACTGRREALSRSGCCCLSLSMAGGVSHGAKPSTAAMCPIPAPAGTLTEDRVKTRERESRGRRTRWNS
jgi:hypothetical protein